MSSATHWEDSGVSASAIKSQLIAASSARFASGVGKSVWNGCSREVRAAPRSQIFSEPVGRNVGSGASRSASFTPAWPAKRLYTDCRVRSARANFVSLLRKEQARLAVRVQKALSAGVRHCPRGRCGAGGRVGHNAHYHTFGWRRRNATRGVGPTDRPVGGFGLSSPRQTYTSGRTSYHGIAES